MKQTHMFPFLRSFLAVLVFAFVFSSCKKDSDVLGANVQDQDDVLNAKYSDTATVKAYTFKVDSVISFNDGTKFIGSNQDPVFGRTDVSLYTKFSIPNNITNVSFGDDANLVSSEIILAVKSLDFVGDYQTPLTYQLYEMNKEISNTQINYSNNNSLYNSSNLLGSFTGTVESMDGLLVIRIPVNQAYAAAILTNPFYLTNNTIFQSTYKGFYLTTKSTNLNPNNNQGAITKIDLDNAKSGFYLYYQNGTISSSKETKTFRFPFNGSNVVRFNQFEYKYLNGGSSLLTNQLQGNTSVGSQGLYLKGLGGTKVKVEFPFLKNYVSQKKISVNKAEIVFKVDQGLNGNDPKYNPPLKLAILAVDSLNRETYTVEQTNSIDLNRYGGSYDSDKKEYVFNIARDIQAIMNGTKKNLGYYLVIANGDPTYTIRRDDRSERVVIGGSGSALYKPTIRLTYIPYEND